MTLDAAPVAADAAEFAGLDSRWKSFEAQQTVADSEEVVRWLHSWGTPLNSGVSG
jgi:predicted transcriptional regulator